MIAKIVLTLSLVGIGWAADGDITLVGVDDANSGMVQIEFGGKKGTVCNYDWDIYAADVVCKQALGTTSKATAYFAPPKGSGLKVFLDGVQCSGYKDTLMECAHGTLGQSACPLERSAGVICWAPEEFQNKKAEGSVRLVNGKTSKDGRAEVFLSDSWGSICDEGWCTLDARVLCKQLGCLDSTDAPVGSLYGPGALDIKLTNLKCAPSNERLIDCPYTVPDNTTACNHTTEAGATCLCNVVSVTVGEQNSGNGVVRITDKAGLQKNLCYDNLTPRTADVVCREAGFVGALSKTMAKQTGNETLINTVYSCEGSEISLTACQSNVSKCKGNTQAAVLCQKKGETEPSAEPEAETTPISSDGLSTGAIVGIVIGVLVGLVAIILIACCLVRGRKGGPASI